MGNQATLLLLLGTLSLTSAFSPRVPTLRSLGGKQAFLRREYCTALRASAEPFEPGEAARSRAGGGRPAGGTDRYSWSQDAKQVLVNVPCPPGTTGRDVQCAIKPSTLSLSVFGEDVFQEEPLAFKIKPVLE